MALEEDAALDERGKIAWVLKRQSDYHLVWRINGELVWWRPARHK
jgi:hypothetical protein